MLDGKLAGVVIYILYIYPRLKVIVNKVKISYSGIYVTLLNSLSYNSYVLCILKPHMLNVISANMSTNWFYYSNTDKCDQKYISMVM